MKKVFIALGVAALLAGCASHSDNENGMGGTSDTYNSSSSSGQNQNAGVQNNASDKAESNTTLTNNNNSGMQP